MRRKRQVTSTRGSRKIPKLIKCEIFQEQFIQKKRSASSFTHSHVLPNPHHFLASTNTKEEIWLNTQNALFLQRGLHHKCSPYKLCTKSRLHHNVKPRETCKNKAVRLSLKLLHTSLLDELYDTFMVIFFYLDRLRVHLLFKMEPRYVWICFSNRPCLINR